MTSTLSTGDTIGIMDAAFFVGKNELISWLNNFFQVSFASFDTLLARNPKGRAVRNRRGLLSDPWRYLPRHSADE